LIPFLPSNVKVEFSARVSHIENVEATFNRPAHVRMIVERAQKHHQSDSHISDSSDTTRNFEADAVIGCDGIKSAVRQNIGAHSVEGGTGQMRYSGTYAYRALLSKDEAIKVNGQDAMKPAMWYGPNKASTFPLVSLLDLDCP
jgi:salicylate hydroxylase